MHNGSNVATFIAGRIETSGQLQKDIAEKVGFEKPNMITMVKQGKTRLPIDKIGPMAQALEIDPVALFAMCMEEYHPSTWKAIAPFLESAMTADERRMLGAIRSAVGGPIVTAMSDDAKEHFDRFLLSLRTPKTIK